MKLKQPVHDPVCLECDSRTNDEVRLLQISVVLNLLLSFYELMVCISPLTIRSSAVTTVFSVFPVDVQDFIAISYGLVLFINIVVSVEAIFHFRHITCITTIAWTISLVAAILFNLVLFFLSLYVVSFAPPTITELDGKRLKVMAIFLVVQACLLDTRILMLQFCKNHREEKREPMPLSHYYNYV